MADQYTFQNLGQLSHTAGQIPFLYDKYNDYYRPIEKSDFGFDETHFDAFNRLRVSEPFTLFDSSHRYADNDLWATATGGTGNFYWTAAGAGGAGTFSTSSVGLVFFFSAFGVFKTNFFCSENNEIPSLLSCKSFISFAIKFNLFKA